MMFEQFSKEARDVVVAAQGVAREADTPEIDTRHVLVAMARADGPAAQALTTAGVNSRRLGADVLADLKAGGLDAAALRAIGIDLNVVRNRTDAVFGEGALARAGRGAPRGHIPFAREAKKAMELALREAIRLQLRRIDSGVLLLGILRADCRGRAVMVAGGVDLDVVRRAVEQPDAQSG